MVSFHFPKRVWLENQNGNEADSCDVIVEMDNGMIYTAMFVTIPYLRRQMDMTYDMSEQLPDTPPVRYAVLETSHIIVDELSRDTIEDTIDNLLALDVFESLFTLVTEDETGEAARTTNTGTGKRATTEIAAVVLSDVLVVEGDE